MVDILELELPAWLMSSFLSATRRLAQVESGAWKERMRYAICGHFGI